MSEALQEQIRKDVQDNRVHIFMKGTPEWPQCGFSKAACDVFRALDVPFSATNVLQDLDNYRTALAAVTQWPTIPQIFVEGEFVGGCDIVVEMYRKGELQKMLDLDQQAAAPSES